MSRFALLALNLRIIPNRHTESYIEMSHGLVVKLTNLLTDLFTYSSSGDSDIFQFRLEPSH